MNNIPVKVLLIHSEIPSITNNESASAPLFKQSRLVIAST